MAINYSATRYGLDFLTIAVGVALRLKVCQLPVPCSQDNDQQQITNSE